MDASEDLAPAVASILRTARDREMPSTDPLGVEARSVSSAIDRAEREGRVPLIAEVKPTSPTSDAVRSEDPVALARAMERGGAAAISVLTEPTHFGGSVDDLMAIRESVDVPVLRKDFLLEKAHLDAVEADIVLLIVRFLDGDLAAMYDAAERRGFQPLVEVHSVEELDRAIDIGADLIGINNRDLAQLHVDLDTFKRVAAHAPESVTLVAESGINDPVDVRRMRTAGADALLVGSSIMAGDVESRTRRLVRAER